jgi:PAS domain S-box-containing protein
VIGVIDHDAVVITRADAAACALLGMEESELIGKPLLELIASEDMIKLATLRLSLLGKRPLGSDPLPDIIYPIQRKDGTIFMGLATTTTLAANRYRTHLHYQYEVRYGG